MKLLVPFYASVTSKDPIEELAVKADGFVRNEIGMMPWPAYNYKPNVSFAIAHGENCILLKYYVSERNIRAVYCSSNEPVYKDTCVEFFISFGNENAYYNFEFNCIGTCLFAYGASRADRVFVTNELIKKIGRQSVISLGSSDAGSINWQLTLMIPFEVFCFHSISTLKNQDCKVNFYKCGDDLPEPHYLSWSNIESEKPDFHLPNFFGETKFL